MKHKFPIGYHDFHSDKLLNFQLNRWFSTGLVGYDEIKKVGQEITDFEDSKRVFKALGEEAIQRGQG